MSGVHGTLFEDNTLVQRNRNKEPIRAIFQKMAKSTESKLMAKPITERPKATYTPPVKKGRLKL